MSINVHGYRTDTGLQVIAVDLIDQGVPVNQEKVQELVSSMDEPGAPFQIRWVPEQEEYVLVHEEDRERLVASRALGFRLLLCEVMFGDESRSSLGLEVCREDVPA